SAERLLLLPLGASAVAVGLGIVVTYNDEFIDLRGTWFILPLVHAVVALPFVIRTIAAVQGAIPLHLRSAAMTLGAPPFRTWRTIEWPLLLPAVRTTAAMSMAISLGEFGATSLLTRRDTDTLPIAVDRLLGRSGDLARLAGLSTAVVLLALTATVFLTLGRSDHGVIR
ncbi:MAG: ABC transporter permease, partial [Ilumatobacteraceae bacterium]